jgi:hypothetical protein
MFHLIYIVNEMIYSTISALMGQQVRILFFFGEQSGHQNLCRTPAKLSLHHQRRRWRQKVRKKVDLFVKNS